MPGQNRDVKGHMSYKIIKIISSTAMQAQQPVTKMGINTTIQNVSCHSLSLIIIIINY